MQAVQELSKLIWSFSSSVNNVRIDILFLGHCHMMRHAAVLQNNTWLSSRAHHAYANSICRDSRSLVIDSICFFRLLAVCRTGRE